MYLPPTIHARQSQEVPAPVLDTFADNGYSSLIGIVTAICGNILISFALNTQRYAHLRLSRDRDEVEEKQRAHQRRSGSQQKTYGPQQEAIAEERAEENAKSEPEGGRDGARYTLEDADESGERRPLIPSIGSRRGSSSSEATARQQEEDEEAPEEKSYLRSPIWWLGIGMMVLGEAGNFLAYGFAPASIVSPLGVVALVSNCLIAPLLLGEQFRWRDGLGVIIAIAGAVTVVLSASDSSPELTPDKIWHLISQWEFETYFGITVFLIVALSVASNKFGERTVLVDLGLVGLYGGYTALSTKGIASLLSNRIWHVVTFPITYLLVAVLVFTAVMQIKYVNRALQRFNATQVIPTQFVLFTISVIVGSAILYRDFEREAAGDAAEFVGGCALTFLGVWCITSGHRDDSEADEEMGDEEDAVDLVDEENVQPEIREREHRDERRRSVGQSSSAETSKLHRHRSESVTPSVVVTPAMRPTSSDDAPHLSLDRTPPREGPSEVPPANAAAIHSKSMQQLGEESNAQSKPPFHATTSAPVIPRSTLDSPASRPRTPLNRNMTGPPADSPSRASPRTPTARRPSQPYLDPNVPQRMLKRGSVVGLLPGPLTSPLSSSLSAIVADSLRRGVDSPAGSMRRRPSKAQRRPTVGGQGASSQRVPTSQWKRHSIASGDADIGNEESAQLRAVTGSPQGRFRSLSATMGDAFGGDIHRQRTKNSIPERPDNES